MMQASLLVVEVVEAVGAAVVTSTATGKVGVGSSCSITSSSSKSGGKTTDMVGEGEGGKEGDGDGGTLVGSSESVSIFEGSSVAGEEVGTPLLIT